MLEFLILGSLSIHEMSGYEIKKLMSNSTAFFSNISDGSLYPTLKRCEENGLVRSKELVENGRFKKVYELTEEGRQIFSDYLEKPLKPLNFRYEMLIRLFFARNLTQEQLFLIIDQHIQQLYDLKQSLDIIAEGPGRNADICQLATLRFGRDFYQYLINWFVDLKSQLEGCDLSQVSGKSAKIMKG